VNGFDKHAQSWKSRDNRVGFVRTLAVVLLGLTPGITISAGGTKLSQGQVKVERKPKFISTGHEQRPFDVTRHIVRLSAIQRSVPRDAIPALIHPAFITAREVGKLLDAKDRVLGVYMNGVAKAYPIRILNWHELMNDEVGGHPILVSW
jgi:Protein of unknown function (DUF3179)